LNNVSGTKSDRVKELCQKDKSQNAYMAISDLDLKKCDTFFEVPFFCLKRV